MLIARHANYKMEKKFYYKKDNANPFIFLDNIDLSLTRSLGEYILEHKSLSNLRWDGSVPFNGSHWWFFPYCFRYTEYRHYMDETVNELTNYKIYKLASPIFSKIESIRPELEIFYAEINLIPPGREITPHLDNPDGIEGRRWYLEGSCRIHVPLITNKEVIMYSGDQSMHMPEGTIYEFHNNLIHSVVNQGEYSRIHLVIDLVPKEYKEDMNYFLQQENKNFHILNLN